MNKRFLSNKERENLIKIFFLKENLESFTTFWKKKKYLTTEQSRNFSSSVTYINKGLNSLLKTFDNKTLKRIQKDAENIRVEFRTRYDLGGLKKALKEKITKEQREQRVEVPIWLLEEFMDFSLNTCSVNCGFKDRADECPIRNIYTQLNFEPFTALPKGNNCEFYLPEKLQRNTLVDTLIESKQSMKVLLDKMNPNEREELLKEYL